MAESNDMPRLRMRYAITIAAERETPYTKSGKNQHIIHPRQTKPGGDSKGGLDEDGRWDINLLVDSGREH